MPTARICEGCTNRPFTFVVFGSVTARIGHRFAIAGESGATRKNPFGRFTIHFQALRLKERPFVPLDAEPLQAFENPIHKLRLVALDIRILDPQEERPAFVFREKPIEQGGSRAADVKIASGRWSETHARLLC